MNQRPHGGNDHGSGDDRNITLNHNDTTDQSGTPDEPARDWEWRRKIRANPHSHLIYRIVVGIVGLMVVVLGLILVPFPGPGWLVVLLGLVIWASEFAWAQRLLTRARHALQYWNRWFQRQPLWIKGIAFLGTVAAVAALFWLLFLISGVPGFFPDGIEEWLHKVPGLAP